MNISLIESLKDVLIQIGKVYDKDFTVNDLSNPDEIKIRVISGNGNVWIASQQRSVSSPTASLQQSPTRKWYQFCRRFNVSPDILGKKISYTVCGRERKGTIRGLRPRISKFCIILETSSGQIRYLSRGILDKSKHLYTFIK